MSPRFARLLTSLHSRAWRERYDAEFLGLLEDLPLSAPLLLDVAGSALHSRRRLAAACAVTCIVALAASIVFRADSSKPGASHTEGFARTSRPVVACIYTRIPRHLRADCRTS